jgi:hypothetical protein
MPDSREFAPWAASYSAAAICVFERVRAPHTRAISRIEE